MVEWMVIAVLILIGVLLLMVEVFFIPGTTIIGILGVIFSGSGVVLAFDHYGTTTGFWVLGLAFVANAWFFYMGVKGRVWSRFALNASIDAKVNEDIDIPPIGMEGNAISALRPMGTASFNGKSYEVRSTGSFISVGTKVRVIRNANRVIIVEPLDTSS
jgi:membrane-bound ClpP family serine protease